ncbi:MAG: sigma-70 family RNA polymerase sigma factor [Bdellovibrionales bacterium]|nr:sigma-70 family RNA polymerase sigma factor [Bdellovibrionales bacterium]
MSRDDLALVEKAKAGDKAAYRQLVERYQKRALVLARDILRSQEDAEDVVQESFVKAYLSLDKFEGKSAFYTWFYRIVYNMAIDVKRKKQRRGGEKAEYEDSLTSDSIDIPVSTQRFHDPQQEVFRKEVSSQIHTAMEQLSDEHRQAIFMREIDGMSYEEIALVLGISKGTVMSRIFYARKKLQQLLQGLASAIRGDEDDELTVVGVGVSSPGKV